MQWRYWCSMDKILLPELYNSSGASKTWDHFIDLMDIIIWFQKTTVMNKCSKIQYFSFLSSRAIVLLHLAFSSSLPSPWFISFKSYIIFLIFWPDVVDSLASLSSYAERSHFSYCNIVKKDQRSLTRKDHRLGGKSKRTVDSGHPGPGIGPGSGCPRFIYSWFLATLHYNCRSPKNIVGISKPRSSHFQEDTFATWFVQHLKNHLYRGMSTRDYTFAGSRASSSSQLQLARFVVYWGDWQIQISILGSCSSSDHTSTFANTPQDSGFTAYLT